MNSLNQTKQQIEKNTEHWSIFLMDFVDDFRRHADRQMLTQPFILNNERFDAVLASTAEALCDERGIEIPEWLASVPACQNPWFVAGKESLKAIALAESPLRFRLRKIFVMENFLERV